MKIEQLKDSCFKITLNSNNYESEPYLTDMCNLFYSLYKELPIDLGYCKLYGFFMNKNLLFKALNLKNGCGSNYVSSEYLFFADLQDNEIIVKFEPVKKYTLEEILK